MKRHRDRTGDISRKYGNELISTLRRSFGPYFAPACDPSSKLSDSLDKLDERSLMQLIGGVRYDS
jgi:hypothetical protein